MQTLFARQPITVIRPSGHINASTAVKFQNQLVQAVSADEVSALVVDLEQVEFLDSAGLMALVSALRLARSLNKRFSLCSVSPDIGMIFELSQLDRVFEIYESVAALEAAPL